MRLVTLDSRELAGRPGISLPSGEILDLSAAPSGLTASQWRPQSVVSVLAEGDEGSARVARLLAEVAAVPEAQRQEWRRTGRLLPHAGTRLMPPIRRPGLLLMITDRSASRPVSYVKNPNAAVGPEATIPLPESDDRQLFLIAMIGLVVGRPLFRANESQAIRAMAALTLVADLGTQRLTGESAVVRTEARQFPGACVVGPALVTLDELSATAGWGLLISVNGRTVGSASPDLNMESAARILAAMSSRYAFRPGDIVGLPAGAAEFELPAASQVTLGLDRTLELHFSTGS